MGLHADWGRRAESRQRVRTAINKRRIAGAVNATNGRWTARSYPPAQPVRGIPIISEEALMTVPWVWRCVNATAGVAAGFPLRRAGRGTSDPWPPMMRWDPIAQTGYTAYHLLRDTYAALQIHGMAFWRPVEFDAMNRPTAVAPLWSQYAYPVRYNTGQVEIQIAAGGNITQRYTPDEVIWFQSTGPLGGDDAYSPVRFLARMAGESILQGEHAHRALVAGGTTQGGHYWSTPDQLTPDLAEEWAALIDEAGGGRAARALVLGDGIEAKPLGMSWAELQLIEARRYSSVEVCSTLGMPPGLLGISIDGASTTYSNLNQDLSLWDRMTLEPLTRTVTETLSVWWDPMEAKATDLTRPMPLDRAKQHEIELRAGYRDVDEVRDDEGWDPNLDLDQPQPAPTMSGHGDMTGQRVMMEEVMAAMNGDG